MMPKAPAWAPQPLSLSAVLDLSAVIVHTHIHTHIRLLHCKTVLEGMGGRTHGCRRGAVFAWYVMSYNVCMDPGLKRS